MAEQTAHQAAMARALAAKASGNPPPFQDVRISRGSDHLVVTRQQFTDHLQAQGYTEDTEQHPPLYDNLQDAMDMRQGLQLTDDDQPQGQDTVPFGQPGDSPDAEAGDTLAPQADDGQPAAPGEDKQA